MKQSSVHHANYLTFCCNFRLHCKWKINKSIYAEKGNTLHIFMNISLYNSNTQDDRLQYITSNIKGGCIILIHVQHKK